MYRKPLRNTLLLCALFGLYGCSNGNNDFTPPDSAASGGAPSTSGHDADIHFTNENLAKISENDQGEALKITLGGKESQGARIFLEGPDADFFQLQDDRSVVPKVAFDYEAPLDKNKDNVYELIVVAVTNLSNDAARNAIDAHAGTEHRIEQPLQLIVTNSTFDFQHATVTGEVERLENTISQQPFMVLTLEDAALPGIEFSLEGQDSDLFTLGEDNALSFSEQFDFERPEDNDKDNHYELILVATNEQGERLEKPLQFRVKDNPIEFSEDIAKTMLSQENSDTSTALTTLSLSDAHNVVYTLDGVDSHHFQLNGNNELQLSAMLDFETPKDHNKDNRYELILVATDVESADITAHFPVELTVSNDTFEFNASIESEFHLEEENLAGHSLTALSLEADEEVNFTLEGEDANHFEISQDNQLVLKSTLDFEAPSDTNTDNRYLLSVVANHATDTTRRIELPMSLTVSNNAVEFASSVVGNVEQSENQATGTLLVQLASEGGEPLSFSLKGDDAAHFQINANNQLVLTAPLNYERPADANQDNEYQVTLVATNDNGKRVEKAFALTVTDSDFDFASNIPNNIDLTEEELPSGALASLALAGQDSVTFSLEGPDKSSFILDNVQLKLSAPLDYEAAGDSNQDNQYDLVLVATDNSDNNRKVEQPLSVTVKNTTFEDSLEVTLNANKDLVFSWENDYAATATHYRLESNIDGSSGFTAVDINNDGNVDNQDLIANSDRQTQASFGLMALNHNQRLFKILALSNSGAVLAQSQAIGVSDIDLSGIVTRLKAQTPTAEADFGESMDISADGKTLVIGSPRALSTRGEAHVFAKQSGTWVYQSALIASNGESGDQFGKAVTISADGQTVVVGAPLEDGGDVNNAEDNSVDRSGAIYVFTHNNGTWTQRHYVKTDVLKTRTELGYSSLALSDDGTTLAAGVSVEDKGSVYVFDLSTTSWQQTQVLTTKLTSEDGFGFSISLSGDGQTLAVGAPNDGRGLPSAPNISKEDSGTVYLYNKSNDQWQQQVYLKASNWDMGDEFGRSVSLSTNGQTLAVGAFNENSASQALPEDNTQMNSGAAYVFSKEGDVWNETQYLKASNSDAGDLFGFPVKLSGNGNKLAVGAIAEFGDGSSPSNNSPMHAYSGAAYVFQRTDNLWTQLHYLKAPEPRQSAIFGGSISFSANGGTLAIGSPREPDLERSLSESGAVYLY